MDSTLQALRAAGHKLESAGGGYRAEEGREVFTQWHRQLNYGALCHVSAIYMSSKVNQKKSMEEKSIGEVLKHSRYHFWLKVYEAQLSRG